MKLTARIERITEQIRLKESLVVGLSGGLDSSVVAALAYRALGDRAIAVTVNSPLTISEDIEDAVRVAASIGIDHLILNLNELELPGFRVNPPERCYLCKQYRFAKLVEFARERGYRLMADGTNHDDLGEHRPGLKAARELGIYSPLAEGGMGRADVVAAAEFFKLPVAGKAHNSCLATRLPYGEELTPERLARINAAERYLHERLQPRELRLREHGSLARIELDRAALGRLLDEDISREVSQHLKQLGYKHITADIEAYRFGSFDE